MEGKPLQFPADAPPWIVLASKFRGTKELTDRGTLNPTIRGFFQYTRYPPSLINTKTAWCAAFACSMLEQCGVRSPRSAAAIDFEDWGLESELILGAILVFGRESKTNARARHVAFYAGVAGDRVLALGGNQRDAVNIQLRDPRDITAVRWPDNR